MQMIHRAGSHIATHHGLYRRLLVLILGVVFVTFVAHWLEVVFATVNLFHFLELDDIAARAGL